ncbi:MAG: M23 family metallopeptidase [Gemmatimonadota bacterium]
MLRLRGHAWTLVFLRKGDTESHPVRLAAGRVLGVGLVAVGLLLSAGWMAGRAWERTSESTQAAEMSAELERLSAERTQMMELAARLERMEADYRRLQRALGYRAPGGSGDIWLPPLEAGAEPAGERAPGSGRSLAWPLAHRGYITRSHGADSGELQPSHAGIDIAVPVGSYVRASRAGVVADIGADRVYGRYVRIDHGDGLSTLYGHNAWTFVLEGDSVEEREVIALSGSTGQSTGPHLHFEARHRGRLIDPLELLDRVSDGRM